MYNPTSIVCNRGQKYFTRKVISYKGKITPVTIHYFTRKTSILNVLIVCLVHHLLDGDPSSSSCHQTSVVHLSTHFFAVSLNLLRSSNEQGCSRRVHCIMCAVFSVARPHSQVVSPS